MWQDDRADGDGSAGPGDQPADDAAASRAPGLPGPAAAPEPTGDARVDAAVRQLAGLPELPVGEHAALFERVHADLVDVLGELDTSQADGTQQEGQG